MSPELVERLAYRALELPNLRFEGYQTHIGRESIDPRFHAAAARGLAGLVAGIAERTGAVPKVLDIGGGFARERDPESRKQALNPHTIENYAEAVVAGLRSVLDDAPFELPELWLEPGRYLAGNGGVLLTTVGAVKRDLGRVWINVDASINNLMRADTSSFHYHVLPATRLNDRYAGPADVVGSLCTGHALASQRELPTLRRGDVLAFLDAGMYAETASTQFNGVPRPATVLVHEGGADLIKRRESVEDVFRMHVVPDCLRATGAMAST
jgi:diaminopimelate decarboxylase